MNRTALLFCFLSLVAHAQGTPGATAPAAPTPPTPTATPAPQPARASDEADADDDDGDDHGDDNDNDNDNDQRDPCLADKEDETDSEVLGALRLSINGENRALADMKLEGLQRLTEARVRELAGIPAAGPLSAEQAARLLQRLAHTGLFTKVAPTVRLTEGTTPVLVVMLEEQPYVTDVDLEGLSADEQEEVREQLFRRPSRDEDEDADDAVSVHVEADEGRVHISARQCPSPNPPRALLASFDEHGAFHPGFVWRGLPAALERALDEVRDEGYELASLDATLSPEGRLVVRVDPGKVEAVEVQGVDEDVAARVREVLGIKPGDVLLRSDLRRAKRRLEAEMPFLSLEDVETHPEAATRFVEERDEAGARHYRPVAEEKKHRREKAWDEDVELSWDKLSGRWNHGTEGAITTQEHRVVVHVSPRGHSFHAELLPMHTQVTGFAPGLSGSLKLWDVRNRVHAQLDAALTIPLRWGGQRIPGDPERTAFQRRLNWLVGAKLQVPVLRLAELGAQVYDFTDTFDRWRMGAIDSYLYSALLNRPDSEYFRRRGFTGLATWRFGQKWTLGAEYRRDTYDSLVSFSPPFSLFRRDSAPFPNSPVDEGRMASVVGRLEFTSDAEPGEHVGSLFRTPELSLLRHDWEWPERTAVRNLLTVEVGDPALGGDEQFRFWKVVSDNALYVNTGRHEGLRLRVRLAGGEDLPLQKQEALGGWSALRGYAFKEFRGDASLLASAEYRFGFLGAFADVGSVHQGGGAGWMDPKLGVGAQLYFGDSVHLSVAWRTDERATFTPEARLLFVRPF